MNKATRKASTVTFQFVLCDAACFFGACLLVGARLQDLEDAAQLGCSLLDWKFEVKMASDRFQAIRKRRLATALISPKGEPAFKGSTGSK